MLFIISSLPGPKWVSPKHLFLINILLQSCSPPKGGKTMHFQAFQVFGTDLAMFLHGCKRNRFYGDRIVVSKNSLAMRRRCTHERVLKAGLKTAAKVSRCDAKLSMKSEPSKKVENKIENDQNVHRKRSTCPQTPCELDGFCI